MITFNPSESDIYVRQDCIYKQLPNGVHQFMFIRSTKHAIHQWIGFLNYIYSEAAPDEPIHVLVEYRTHEPPPVNYAVQRLNQWRQMNPTYYPDRIAFVVSNAALATLLYGASRILRISSDKIRVFTDEPDDEVIKWLTSA
jgi:hypothetical protein